MVGFPLANLPPQLGKKSDVVGIFADHALTLLKRGLAVLPCAGKAPLVGGFNRWRQPPSELTVEKWRSKFPDANIGYHAALSGLIVVDADSIAAIDKCRSVFGATPGRVRTRRGEHALYRAPAGGMPASVNLRAFGFDADLKFERGSSIVIAPPSLHPAGGTYRWIDCDPTVLGDLPIFDVSCLQKFLVRPSVEPSPARMRDGSRKQWLNDRLCAQVGFCDSFDDLLDVAMTLNDELEHHGPRPLEEDIVVQRTRKVWTDFQIGKLEARPYAEATVKISRTELNTLETIDHVGAPHAMILLMHFRFEHSSRNCRGETFAVTPKAMARSQVILGWTRERYEKARNLLLRAGLIELVSPMTTKRGVRTAAQYRLRKRPGAGRF